MELNAPPGYRWTDDDVRYEKRDSWYSGLMVGWLSGAVAALLVFNLCAAFIR